MSAPYFSPEKSCFHYTLIFCKGKPQTFENRILLGRILRLRRVAKRQILFRRSAIHAERYLLYRKCNVISCKEKKNVPWHILLSAAARSTQSAILLYTKCMFSRVYDFFSPVGQHDLRLHSTRNLYVQQQFLSLIPPLADDFSPRRFVPCFCMSQ